MTVGDLADLSVECLLNEQRPQILAILARYRVPASDAEDLVQDALLALVYKHESIRKPQAWLLGTLRNRCRLYWRQRRLRICESLDEALISALESSDAPGGRNVDARIDLERVLPRISNVCQQAIRLRYLEDRSAYETAELLGYKRSGIHKVMERCLMALAKQLTLAP